MSPILGRWSARGALVIPASRSGSRPADAAGSRLRRRAGAGGHSYGKDHGEQAAFISLGCAFLRSAIGWDR